MRLTPVVLDYADEHKTSLAKWKWAHGHVVNTVYLTNGKSAIGQSVNVKWGKTAP